MLEHRGLIGGAQGPNAGLILPQPKPASVLNEAACRAVVPQESGVPMRAAPAISDGAEATRVL